MLLASEDIKQKTKTNGPNRAAQSPGETDQEEGGEVDSHEKVRLSLAGPGEINRREVVLNPQVSPENMSREVELGSKSWTSFAAAVAAVTDIVLATVLHLAVETAIA